ncbi:tRNA (guanine(10)-N(2))-dimethyltransferase [uncultured Methanobrevibacter sp.]|uniref:tRNA (guanine(10)-N(2))-dimethyltransferase n=1 Tax=uncultured Methanobrevibacter sp. TaxID=253161 RepID=UPI002611C767
MENNNNYSKKEIKEYSEDELKIIEEGNVQIKFPDFDKVSSDAPVFYNPRMEFNRDTSILALQAYQKEVDREINICDLFGGSGIRGIRYKKEIDGVDEVNINDISELANEFTRINAELNDVDVTIDQKEANIELRSNMGKFDVIDIDPFGTPSPFVDSAGYNFKRDALLCLTATDTSCLSGTYPEPCIRKYNAKPYKSEYYHENGIRILIGFAALTLAKYQKYIEVKLSHSSEHYMRTYMKVKKGSKATDESLKNIGYISHCKNCLYRTTSNGLATAIPETCPECGEKLVHAGPMWLGPIQDREFIEEMIEIADTKDLNTKNKVLKMLNSCKIEADAPASFYDIHKICRNLKISAPKLDLVFDKLKEEGFIAVKTHFSPLGIKTDAKSKEIKEIVLKLAED